MAAKTLTTFKGATVSTLALAELFGVSDRTIRNYCDDGLPKISNGKFNLLEAFAWWQENMNKPTSDKEEKARERYWSAKADREELSVKKLQESVLDKADLDVVWTNRVIEVVKGLESQETILPTILENKKAPEIRKIIADYNRKLRLNYARDGKYTPVEEYNKLVEPVKKIVKPTKKKAKKKK